MKTLRFTPAVALLAACSDNTFNALEARSEPREAAIEVTPSSIDFGAVTTAEQTAFDHVTITSVGTSDLLVESVELDGKDAPRFTVVGGEKPFFLPAGASKELEVSFDPNGSLDAVGEITVTSDDDVSPTVPVDLRGSAAIAQLAISPDPGDFGVVDVGCDATHPVAITSVGDEPVTIDSIAAAGDGYALSYGFSLPQTLQPGESLSVDLTFAPSDESDVTGSLTVDSNDYYGVRKATQYGMGRFASAHHDDWTIGDRDADIVFFVDHSGSMADDASALATNFGTFITHLNDYSSSWRVLVASDVDGCNIGGILDASTPSYASTFESAVTDTPLLPAPYVEAGLTVSDLAVDATDAGECNAGFLRDGALLHIIMVSDEIEQSAHTWSYYVDRIVAKKGDASLVRMSAIGDAGAELEPGYTVDGYKEAAAATGGTYLSIYSDWAETMDALADATLTQSVFALTNPDVVTSSVSVTVDGQPASGWTFDTSTNSVVFDTASAPSEGHSVSVEYGTYGTCE